MPALPFVVTEVVNEAVNEAINETRHITGSNNVWHACLRFIVQFLLLDTTYGTQVSANVLPGVGANVFAPAAGFPGKLRDASRRVS
jgi:hypothetical protein